MAAAPPEPAPDLPEAPFDDLVCTIDGSDEAVEGAYQASCLAPGRPLTLVHVIDVLDAPAVAGMEPEWMHGQRRAAAEVLASARIRLEALGVASAIDLAAREGTREDVFRDLTAGGPGRLVTMGSGEWSEPLPEPPAAIPPPTLDRLTRRVLDVAGCSVLVARPRVSPGAWPRSITVGVDGSPASIHAYEVAAALAALNGAQLTAVTALDHRRRHLRAAYVGRVPIPVELTEDRSAEATLLTAARRCDLVVVGRRGVHRSRGMGTVSAKVAAFSPVSVLVVHRS